MNEQSVGKVVAAPTGHDSRLTHRSRRDVVLVYSLDTLADSRRRDFCYTTDQALLAISHAKDKVGGIIVANPWRSAPIVALRSLISRGGGDVPIDRVTLVRPLRLRRRDPTKVPALRQSYQRYDGILEHHARGLGLDSPAVLTFNPFVAAFCPLRWASTVTYYAQDDWASYSPVAPWWPAYRHAYSEIRERGARIICVSDELAARVAAGGHAVIIPNGINPDEWDELPPAPPVVSELVRPIVTYVGTIDERLDIGLVTRVANDGVVGSIALIGPCEDGVLEGKLRSIPKVTLCGAMSRAELAGALDYSDACIIPHVVSPLTRAMSPLKLYEYLAAGKPVATTNLAPVSGIHERVISSAGDDFPAAVRAALNLPGQPDNERREFVRSNSWAARHERMLRVVLSGEADWWES